MLPALNIKSIAIFLAYFLALGLAGVHAHETAWPPISSTATQKLGDLTTQLLQAGSGSEVAALTNLVDTARQRQALMKDLMEHGGTAEVLKIAIPKAQRAALPTEVLPYIESEAAMTGTLEIMHVHYWNGAAEYLYNLKTGSGENLPLYFAQKEPQGASGGTVKVKGLQVGEALAMESDAANNLEVLQAAPLPNTFGPQKTLVILVNFSNAPLVKPYTIDEIKTSFSLTSDFLMEYSYQQTSLNTDVFGWYTIPLSNTSCDFLQIQSQAQKAATDHGIALGAYARQVYLFPTNPTCNWSGLSSRGGNPSSAWMNGSRQPAVIVHEMGHSLGLWHSHALDCGAVALGNSCASMDVNNRDDAFDAMGTGAGAHFNAFQKERLGWLNYGVSPPITTVQMSGTFTLSPYEVKDNSTKALKIPRGTTGQSFYVEYRTKTGLDATLPWAGPVIHLATDGAPDSSGLLDMTPETISWQDGILDAGKSFTDFLTGLTIKTTAVTSTSATIQVTLSGAISACDVNKNSSTNVADVQLCVNQALGSAPCTADINQDGACNVIDVQRVANAATGGVCVTTP